MQLELNYSQVDGDGPPLLVVHGFLASIPYWNSNIEALRAVSSPVLVELWGHGSSPSPSEPERYTPLAYGVEFDRLRESLGIDRWAVLGQSLGGALAVRYALTHSDRVSAVVFTNSRSATTPNPNAEATSQTERLADKVDQIGMAAFEDHPMNPARSKRLPPDVRDVLTNEVFAHDPVGIAETLRHTVPTASVIHDAAQLSQPALLTWGIHEAVFAAGAEKAIERIPNLEVARLDGGHAVNIGDPDGFASAVTAFVRKHSYFA